MLSLGPIAEGYTLIITRQHIECCAALPAMYLSEFLAILKAVSSVQNRLYGASIYYEHGRTGSCLPDARGEPHCHHAHLHCVPVAYEMRREVEHDYPTETLPGWSELLERYERSPQPYLLVEDEGRPSIAVVPERIPRQYLRTLAAKHVGEEHLADWGAFQGWERISRAKETMTSPLIEAARKAGLVLT